jgi:hypothetical protein
LVLAILVVAAARGGEAQKLSNDPIHARPIGSGMKPPPVAPSFRLGNQ